LGEVDGSFGPPCRTSGFDCFHIAQPVPDQATKKDCSQYASPFTAFDGFDATLPPISEAGPI
jgi:hypothetical protein